MQKRKCAVIELWRVAFSFLIVACHATALPWYSSSAQWFKSASIGVEFFFILSGFLMAKSAKKSKEGDIGKDTTQFIFSKLKTIYPTYLFALCFEIFVSTFVAVPEKWSLSKIIYYIWDVLFLRVACLQGDSILMAVGASWYLSAMILAMWIIYPFLIKNEDIFIHIIAPLASIFIFGWFSNVYGNIKFQLDFNNGICLGLLRAIAEISLGAVCWKMTEWVAKNVKETSLTRLICTILEICSFCGVFWISWRFYRSQMDFVAIFLIAVGVIMAFSGLSYTILLNNIINVKWAGKFSLALYLNHVVFIRMFSRWNLPISFSLHVVLLFVMSVVAAIFCMSFIDIVSGIYKSRKIS